MNEQSTHTPNTQKTPLVDRIDTYLDTRFPGYDDRLAPILKRTALGAATVGSIVAVGAIGGGLYNEFGPRETVMTGVINEYVAPENQPTDKFNIIKDSIIAKAAEMSEKHGINIDDISGARKAARDVFDDNNAPSVGGIIVTVNKKPFSGYDIVAQGFEVAHQTSDPATESKK